MKLIRLNERPNDWNCIIKRYETKTLFHEAAWLDHISSIHPEGRIEYFRIAEGSNTLGYLCGLRFRKFLLSVFGSPLRGTGTNYMGPIVNRGVDQAKLVQAILEEFKKNGIAHLEFSNDWLESGVMKAQGFNVHHSVTHICPLPDNEEAAWGLLRSTCRNRIRKAEKNGLVVEMTDDPSIVDHFYSQYKEVYGKQGLAVGYDIDRPRSLFNALMPADRIFPLWVKHKGEVIAAGFFPHDERCVYFWGAASWLKYHPLCPNEILHWTVTKLAIARHIPLYNMCGGTSQFKDKFGGSDVPYVTYTRSFLPFLEAARKLYTYVHFRKLKLLGWLRPSDVPRKKRVG